MIRYLLRAVLPSPIRSRLYRIWWMLVGPIARAYLAVEFCLQFLRHRQEIHKADFIYFLWSASFGHQAMRPDFLARRFWKRRLLVILIDHGVVNPYLLDSFRPVLNVHRVTPSSLAQRLNRRPIGKKGWQDEVYRVALSLAFPRSMSSKTIVHPFFDKTLVMPDHPQILYYPQWLRLMREVPEADIEPAENHIQTFKNHLQELYPELKSRWFVAIYLRRKFDWRQVPTEVFNSPKTYDLDSWPYDLVIDAQPDVRDTFQPSYRAVIQRIGALGGFVFLGGDVDLRVFADLQNWVSYSDFDCGRWLTDFFFLTQCRFLISGHSGPIAIAAVFNVPTLITNNAFFWQSGFRENQIQLCKNVRERSTGRILTAEEVNSAPVVNYYDSSHFEEAGFEVVDNSETQIMEAAAELISRYILGVKRVDSEHSQLYEWYRSMLPKWSVGYMSPARPALSYLKSLREEISESQGKANLLQV